MRSHRVFVYGTLKEGFPNFGINRGRRVPGEFVTATAYPFYLAGERWSAWLIDEPGAGLPVRGQVFDVDDAGLAAMDALERVAEPDGYLRRLIPVLAVGDTAVPAGQAHVYLKRREQVDPALLRLGPLEAYTLAHAARYRPRA